jgi:hypothetical protein
VVKLLMRWNIKQGKEADYFEYVLKEFAPGINKLGLQLTESWYTVYGEGPQILTGAVTDSQDEMQTALDNEAWPKMVQKLKEYVTDFGYKVVPAMGRFQL